MENATPVQTDELVVSLARRVQANRADLIARYRQSLQETLFTNRSEVRPRELGAIAEGEADALVGSLSHPQKGVEHGAKLCQMGLSEQTILGLNHATRQFILAIFERDLIPLALDAADGLSKCSRFTALYKVARNLSLPSRNGFAALCKSPLDTTRSRSRIFRN